MFTYPSRNRNVANFYANKSPSSGILPRLRQACRMQIQAVHTQSFSTACSASDRSPLCAIPSWRRAVRLIGCARNAGHTSSRLISQPAWMVIPGKPIAIASLLISPSRLRRQSVASLQTMPRMFVAAAAPFESMVKPVKSYRDLIEEKIDVWGIGPGLGRDNAPEIIELIQRAENPMVVDADALNIVSTNVSILKHCRGPRLLTPHPG